MKNSLKWVGLLALSLLMVFSSRPVFADSDSDAKLRADVHYKKAKDYMLNDKDFDNARMEIKAAIELNDHVASYWKMLGGLDELLDANYEEAVHAWRTYLKMSPNLDSDKKASYDEKIAALENKLDSEKTVEKKKEQNVSQSKAEERDNHIMNTGGLYINYTPNVFASNVYKFKAQGTYTDPNYANDTFSVGGGMAVSQFSSYELQLGGAFKCQNPFVDYLLALDLVYGTGTGSAGTTVYNSSGVVTSSYLSPSETITMGAVNLVTGFDFTLNKPSQLGGVFQFHIPVEVGAGLMWTTQPNASFNYVDGSGTKQVVTAYNNDFDFFLLGDAGLGLRIWFSDSVCIDAVGEYQGYLVPSAGIFLANTAVSSSSVSPTTTTGFRTKFQMKFLL